MKKTEEKTNVIRFLEQKKVPFSVHTYGDSAAIAATEVAEFLGQDPCRVFKTLVTVGHSGGHYVFVVPSLCELDLKKAAKAVGEKNIAMIKSKELLPLTGYIHGGCSPIGMKKQFRTVMDSSAARFETVLFSGGRIGWQVELAASELQQLIPLTFAEISVWPSAECKEE